MTQFEGEAIRTDRCAGVYPGRLAGQDQDDRRLGLLGTRHSNESLTYALDHSHTCAKPDRLWGV